MKRLVETNPGVFEAIRRDADLMDEIESFLKGKRKMAEAEAMGFESAEIRKTFSAFADSRGIENVSDGHLFTEAIILRRGRPSFLIKDGRLVVGGDEQVWHDRLRPSMSDLEAAIAATGRIELVGHESYPWVGTGWLVTQDLILTNRHVASVFASRANRRYVFKMGTRGREMEAFIDFREEFGNSAEEVVEIAEVLYMAPDEPGQPDMAVLKLKRSVAQPPVRLSPVSEATEKYVAVIGYPARDDRRNDPAAARDIFRDIYEKKRLAPGELITPNEDRMVLRHDCSTLGGNSGSVVLDASTGLAIGLHFGGRFELSNYAVRVEVVHQILNQVHRGNPPSAPVEEASAEDYSDRRGYDPDFIGRRRLFVGLPSVTGELASDVTRQTSGPHRGSPELKYTHFSIVMSESKKLPYFTACNIDGSSLRRPRRERDVWRFDPRINRGLQIGNDLYSGNNLDRGHQVRRLDPVWGDEDEATQAQEDTFHYTNCCPQHARLNQGRTQWAGLEDYILDNTDSRNLRVSVFTGPVLARGGIDYRDEFVPEEYWKVVANARSDGSLSATGYLLSQGQFLDDIEFAFGAYQTFQVRIRQVEDLTGVSFGNLSEADPLERIEAPGGFIAIDNLEQIVMG